ncbi:hypothetical protein AC1031_004804 [Aphanomyces cochlioides]|nr:hypothetical protein AC1031_004804 [Aphanomyces cochlioides]
MSSDAAQRALQRKSELQRQRRTQIRSEIASLQKLARKLEAKRDALSEEHDATAPLSWKQVAKAMQDELSPIEHENVKLKRQRQAMLNVITTMTKWISAAKDITRGPGSILHSASNMSLHLVTLSALNPDCRRHGLDWLTQILYQNTNAFLMRYAMEAQPPNCVYGDFHVDVSDLKNVQHVFQAQVDIPYDMDNVVDPVRVHVVDRLSALDVYAKSVTAIDPEIVQRVSPLMTYKRRVSQSGVATWAMNVLYREFQEPNRVTFVGQSVEDDKFEKVPFSKRKSMTWVVVTRLGPSMTRVTFMSLSSLEYNDNKFRSLEDQARRYGFQLDGNDPMIAEKYASSLKVVGDPGVATYTAYLANVVQASKEREKAKDQEDLLSLFLQ